MTCPQILEVGRVLLAACSATLLVVAALLGSTRARLARVERERDELRALVRILDDVRPVQ